MTELIKGIFEFVGMLIALLIAGLFLISMKDLAGYLLTPKVPEINVLDRVQELEKEIAVLKCEVKK